jgi:hypothetical protein
MLMLVIFAQAGAVCQVVNCSLPEPPQCPHHQPEPESVMTACDAIAAIPSSDWTDWAVMSAGSPALVFERVSLIHSSSPAAAISFASTPPVLRI